MRPAYLLTNWLVEPLRRILPPMGMFDLSPLAALFVLWAIERLLLSLI
jgi:YggT family protein